MKYVIHTILYIVTIFALMQSYYFVAAALIVLFTIRTSAAWLIPMAIMVDGFYGAFYTTPAITLAVVTWYIVSEFLKPKIFVERDTYGKIA